MTMVKNATPYRDRQEEIFFIKKEIQEILKVENDLKNQFCCAKNTESKQIALW